MLLWLLHRVLVLQIDTYQASKDDMDDRFLFVTLWMVCLFVGVAPLLPQLWLIARHGCVDALLSQALCRGFGCQPTLERRLLVAWAQVHHVPAVGRWYQSCFLGDIGGACVSPSIVGGIRLLLREGYDEARFRWPFGAAIGGGHYV